MKDGDFMKNDKTKINVTMSLDINIAENLRILASESGLNVSSFITMFVLNEMRRKEDLKFLEKN